jgi:molecular chaperone DnaK (HSP70)
MSMFPQKIWARARAENYHYRLSGLNKEEIDKMVKDAEQHSEEDKKSGRI